MPTPSDQTRQLKNALGQFACGAKGHQETDELLAVVFRFVRSGGCLDEMQGALDEAHGMPNRSVESLQESFSALLDAVAPSGGKSASSTKRS